MRVCADAEYKGLQIRPAARQVKGAQSANSERAEEFDFTGFEGTSFWYARTWVVILVSRAFGQRDTGC